MQVIKTYCDVCGTEVPSEKSLSPAVGFWANWTPKVCGLCKKAVRDALEARKKEPIRCGEMVVLEGTASTTDTIKDTTWSEPPAHGCCGTVCAKKR